MNLLINIPFPQAHWQRWNCVIQIYCSIKLPPVSVASVRILFLVYGAVGQVWSVYWVLSACQFQEPSLCLSFPDPGCSSSRHLDIHFSLWIQERERQMGNTQSSDLLSLPTWSSLGKASHAAKLRSWRLVIMPWYGVGIMNVSWLIMQSAVSETAETLRKF